jgi:hypothetical protein
MNDGLSVGPWATYLDLYKVQDNDAKKLIYREQDGMTYIRDTIFEVNGSYSDVVSVVYESDGRDVKIYPNPALSEVTLTVSQPAELVVSDVLGKVLLKQTVTNENNVVDVSGMPSGLLIFSLQNGQKVKVIKE